MSRFPSSRSHKSVLRQKYERRDAAAAATRQRGDEEQYRTTTDRGVQKYQIRAQYHSRIA